MARQAKKKQESGTELGSEAHAGRVGEILGYGQDSNSTTWRLAKMNFAFRGIGAQLRQGKH